mgnify:FL=1
MQTSLAKSFLDTDDGQVADRILRNCVHCGFCNATCPTYQILGDELDGPRGRIYQIKQTLEGSAATSTTQLHLDRCLTCRACETTCPSGVEYSRLLDIGRELIARSVPRPWHQRAFRWGLRSILPYPSRFGPLLRLGQMIRPLLPSAMRKRVPERKKPSPVPRTANSRQMLLLDGCVQPSLAPQINTAAIRTLNRLGIALFGVPGAVCCGAVSQHLDAPDEALDFARRNIDKWWPMIESGAEAIVITASGCATQIKNYSHLLRNDPVYADKAARISAVTKDLSEVLAVEDLRDINPGRDTRQRVAFQSPCTLQHGQKLGGVVEKILTGLGYTLCPIRDTHLCCGSAGTYSILQPSLSDRLRDNKLRSLQADKPDIIATANIGCLSHLEMHAQVPVVHWIELLD